jgi:type II secretory pathway pseudopilin PulG
MNMGGEQSSAKGFTVVETLIVLAVTGSLFVSAALLINGRQNKTDFQVGSRNLQQQFQQIINEARTGYYPNSGTLKCERAPGASQPLTLSTVSVEQGTNGACIFAGKTLVFNGSAAGKSQYGVYSLAGQRSTDGSTEGDVKTPEEAQLTALDENPRTPDAPADITQHVTMPNGLTFVKGREKGGAWTSAVFPIAFVSSMANFSGSGGAQQMELRGYSTAPWSVGSDEGKSIDDEIAASNPSPPYPLWSEGAELCFASGGTDQSMLVTISGGLEVHYLIKPGVDC